MARGVLCSFMMTLMDSSVKRGVVTPCNLEVVLYVPGRFRQIEVRQVPFTDLLRYCKGRWSLQGCQKLCLANQDQAHRRIIVSPEVREKAYLPEHLLDKQVSLVDDHHRVFSLAFSHVDQHCVQMALSVPTIEPRFDSKLIQASSIEISRGKFRIMYV